MDYGQLRRCYYDLLTAAVCAGTLSVCYCPSDEVEQAERVRTRRIGSQCKSSQCKDWSRTRCSSYSSEFRPARRLRLRPSFSGSAAFSVQQQRFASLVIGPKPGGHMRDPLGQARFDALLPRLGLARRNGQYGTDERPAPRWQGHPRPARERDPACKRVYMRRSVTNRAVCRISRLKRTSASLGATLSLISEPR